MTVEANYHYRTKNPIIASYLSKLPPGKLLDVGCSNGELGRFLSALHYEVWGIDINQAFIEEATPFLHKAICGDINEIDKLGLNHDYFDVVVFADILEHIVEPELCLSNAIKYLKPGGLAIISLPNIGNFKVIFDLFFGRFQYEDVGILDKTHLRFFTLSSGQELVQRCGLEIFDIRVSHWNWNISFIRKINSSFHHRLKDWLAHRFKSLLATQIIFFSSKR